MSLGECNYMEEAFQKLKERGWYPGEFKTSHIAEEEILLFEEKHKVALPSLYNAFLTSYQLPGIECSAKSKNFI